MNDHSGSSNVPVALITGASRGIGRELARQFARNGHDLVLVARSDKDLQQLAETLRGEYDVAVTTLCHDLAADGAAAELHRACRERGFEIDTLVNNAGIGDYGDFIRSDPDRLEQMLRLNVLSLTALTRQFLPEMVARGRGRVLNVASLVVFFSGGPHWVSYVASKHYVL
ncbi:MAG: SDR family NAD(P)-dependent oxidoreductase, partial [Gammaproteobacteria bacterium]